MTNKEKEQRKARIKAIAMQLILSRVDKGEIDGENEEELQAATAQAIKEAKQTHDAALEFLS